MEPFTIGAIALAVGVRLAVKSNGRKGAYHLDRVLDRSAERNGGTPEPRYVEMVARTQKHICAESRWAKELGIKGK